MDKTIVKTIFIITCFLGFANMLFAQEQTKHQPKSYVDKEGRLYWNKKLPVYIRIASSPTDEGHLMQSEKTPAYTNPYFLDTEGVNRIRSRWATDQESGNTIYPQQEVIWEVYADGLPPVSRLVFKNKAKYRKKGEDFFGDSLVIEIVSKDAVSGVSEIYYSINGEAYKQYSQPIKVDQEGAQTIKYYAVDNVGNVEEPKEKRFTADISGPKTYYTITGIANEEVVATTTKIVLTSEDEMSGVAKTYYKIDDGKEVLYPPGTHIPISTLPDGKHKLTIYSVDKVGNKESPIEIPFYLDRTAPIVAADILGDRYLMGDKIFFSGRTKMKLTAVDNKAGVEDIFYSVNNSKFEKYSQPFYLPSIPGVHTVKYYAVDKMSNDSRKGESKYEKYKHVVSRIYVDLSGPQMSHVLEGPNYKTRDTLFISPKTKLKFKAFDKESGLQKITYGVNSESDEVEYDEFLSIQEEGFKHIVYYGYDNVNNRNRKELSVYVDSTGPEIKYNFSIAPQGLKDGLPVYPSHTSLFLGAIDQLIGAKNLYYRINNGPEKKYTFYITGFKKDAINTVHIKAKDYLANETSTDVQFYVE